MPDSLTGNGAAISIANGRNYIAKVVPDKKGPLLSAFHPGLVDTKPNRKVVSLFLMFLLLRGDRYMDHHEIFLLHHTIRLVGFLHSLIFGISKNLFLQVALGGVRFH